MFLDHDETVKRVFHVTSQTREQTGQFLFCFTIVGLIIQMVIYLFFTIKLTVFEVNPSFTKPFGTYTFYQERLRNVKVAYIVITWLP